MPEVAALSSGVPGQTASMPVRLGSTRSDNDTHSQLTDTDIDIMIDGLLEDLESSEFYCSLYATKEQTLAHGLTNLELDIAKKEGGQSG